MKSWLLFALWGYQQVLSPLLNQFLITAFGVSAGCRYQETCSRYTARQIKTYGILTGIRLGTLRILSCWGWRE